jgi:hypothetical protein
LSVISRQPKAGGFPFTNQPFFQLPEFGAQRAIQARIIEN